MAKTLVAVSYTHLDVYKRQVLDEIEGIGPVRRKTLLEHFKSVERIKQASREELENAPGVTARAAESVWTYFHIAKNRT